MSTIYNLEPTNNQKSFYGKARVIVHDNGDKDLISYNTLVAKKRNNKIVLGDYATCSNTTLKHLRSFLESEGFRTYSKNDLRKYYDSERF